MGRCRHVLLLPPSAKAFRLRRLGWYTPLKGLIPVGSAFLPRETRPQHNRASALVAAISPSGRRPCGARAAADPLRAPPAAHRRPTGAERQAGRWRRGSRSRLTVAVRLAVGGRTRFFSSPLTVSAAFCALGALRGGRRESTHRSAGGSTLHPEPSTVSCLYAGVPTQRRPFAAGSAAESPVWR